MKLIMSMGRAFTSPKKGTCIFERNLYLWTDLVFICIYKGQAPQRPRPPHIRKGPGLNSPWVPSGGAVLVAVGCVVAVVAAVAVVAVVPVVAVVALVAAVAALVALAVALAAALGGASGAGAKWYDCRRICACWCWDWCGAGGGRAAHLNTRTCRRH